MPVFVFSINQQVIQQVFFYKRKEKKKEKRKKKRKKKKEKRNAMETSFNTLKVIIISFTVKNNLFYQRQNYFNSPILKSFTPPPTNFDKLTDKFFQMSPKTLRD